jgi:glycosyltransferase involved in cell wall biosynthesis
MYKSKTVAVVVPCYNEERQIGKVIETMPDYVDYMIIVDDTSKDRTIEVVEDYAKKDARIVLLKHEVNQGVGAAISTGYKWAAEKGIDCTAVMAGDAQMDPADLPALLDPAVEEGVHYVKGNRLIHDDALSTIPKIRLFGNSVLSLLTKIASGYWHVADSQTGYTVINKEAIQTINWDKIYKRYGQPNDILVTMNVFQFRVRDVPIRPVYNVGEVSGIRIRKVVFTISGLLARRFLWRIKERYILRDFHPLVFFFMLGALLGVVSLGLFIRLVWLWIAQGSAPELTAIALMMSSSLAFQSLSFGMWLDMDSNRHLR